jgi:hypothetical protein
MNKVNGLAPPSASDSQSRYRLRGGPIAGVLTSGREID